MAALNVFFYLLLKHMIYTYEKLINKLWQYDNDKVLGHWGLPKFSVQGAIKLKYDDSV